MFTCRTNIADVAGWEREDTRPQACGMSTFVYSEQHAQDSPSYWRTDISCIDIKATLPGIQNTWLNCKWFGYVSVPLHLLWSKPCKRIREWLEHLGSSCNVEETYKIWFLTPHRGSTSNSSSSISSSTPKAFQNSARCNSSLVTLQLEWPRTSLGRWPL
jgi:hypothetical protein